MTKHRSEFDRGVIYGIGLACAISAAGNGDSNNLAQVLDAAGLDRDKLRRIGLDPYDMGKLRKVFELQDGRKPFKLHHTFVEHFPHSVVRPGRPQKDAIVPAGVRSHGEIHDWLVSQFGKGTYRSSRYHTKVHRDCTLRWAFADWTDQYHFRNEQDATLFKLFWING